jgi:hypothetical protein
LSNLEKNSTNSSKPPLSDIFKAAKPEEVANGQKRKQGAQKGHKKHERTPFPPEQIDKTIVHQLPQCPHCGGKLELVKENAESHQQIELVTKPYEITEHHYNLYWSEAYQDIIAHR